MGLQVEWNGLEGRVVRTACLYFIINKNKNIKNGPPGNTNKSGKPNEMAAKLICPESNINR